MESDTENIKTFFLPRLSEPDDHSSPFLSSEKHEDTATMKTVKGNTLENRKETRLGDDWIPTKLIPAQKKDPQDNLKNHTTLRHSSDMELDETLNIFNNLKNHNTLRHSSHMELDSTINIFNNLKNVLVGYSSDMELDEMLNSFKKSPLPYDYYKLKGKEDLQNKEETHTKGLRSNAILVNINASNSKLRNKKEGNITKSNILLKKREINKESKQKMVKSENNIKDRLRNKLYVPPQNVMALTSKIKPISNDNKKYAFNPESLREMHHKTEIKKGQKQNLLKLDETEVPDKCKTKKKLVPEKMMTSGNKSISSSKASQAKKCIETKLDSRQRTKCALNNRVPTLLCDVNKKKDLLNKMDTKKLKLPSETVIGSTKSKTEINKKENVSIKSVLKENVSIKSQLKENPSKQTNNKKQHIKNRSNFSRNKIISLSAKNDENNFEITENKTIFSNEKKIDDKSTVTKWPALCKSCSKEANNDVINRGVNSYLKDYEKQNKVYRNILRKQRPQKPRREINSLIVNGRKNSSKNLELVNLEKNDYSKELSEDLKTINPEICDNKATIKDSNEDETTSDQMIFCTEKEKKRDTLSISDGKTTGMFKCTILDDIFIDDNEKEYLNEEDSIKNTSGNLEVIKQNERYIMPKVVRIKEMSKRDQFRKDAKCEEGDIESTQDNNIQTMESDSIMSKSLCDSQNKYCNDKHYRNQRYNDIFVNNVSEILDNETNCLNLKHSNNDTVCTVGKMCKGIRNSKENECKQNNKMDNTVEQAVGPVSGHKSIKQIKDLIRDTKNIPEIETMKEEKVDKFYSGLVNLLSESALDRFLNEDLESSGTRDSINMSCTTHDDAVISKCIDNLC